MRTPILVGGIGCWMCGGGKAWNLAASQLQCRRISWPVTGDDRPSTELGVEITDVVVSSGCLVPDVVLKQASLDRQNQQMCTRFRTHTSSESEPWPATYTAYESLFHSNGIELAQAVGFTK